MEKLSSEDLAEALDVVVSTIKKCEKIQPKFPTGTSQHSLLKNRIKALTISEALITENENAGPYSKVELTDALKPIVSIINKCESGQKKHDVQSAQYKRFQKIIEAMKTCQMLISDEISKRI